MYVHAEIMQNHARPGIYSCINTHDYAEIMWKLYTKNMQTCITMQDLT